MPNYQGHLLGGFVTFGFTLAVVQKVSQNYIVNPFEVCLWLLICLLGALFPDIDIRSKGQRIYYELLFCLMLFSIFFNQWNLIIGLSMASIMPLMTKHRGTVHTLWFITCVPLIVPYTLSAYNRTWLKPSLICYIFFVAGAISHLLLDFGPKKLIKRTFFSNKKRKISKKRNFKN